MRHPEEMEAPVRVGVAGEEVGLTVEVGITVEVGLGVCGRGTR